MPRVDSGTHRGSGAARQFGHQKHPSRGGPRAEVRRVEHLGDQNHVHLKLDTHSLVTLADPAQDLKAGDEVSLEFMHPLFFDRAGNRIAAEEAFA